MLTAIFDRIKGAIYGASYFRSAERKRVNKFINRKVKKLLQSHYDNADTSAENRRHWKEARENTPSNVNNRETRRKLRIRARYEHDNNCYCSGMVSTLSKDVVGVTAPKLQILTPSSEFNSLVESEWRKWSRDATVNLTYKLKLLDSTRRVEGESFLFHKTDKETLKNTGYSLNVDVIGPARVTDPRAYEGLYDSKSKTYNDDGVIVDKSSGRPISYTVIPPNNELYSYSLIESNQMTIGAKYMHQWFMPTRPGQFRGVSEIQAAIGKFAHLRRYSLATVIAAEVAASFTAIMKTSAPPNDGPVLVKDYTEIDINRGMMISVPEGWEPYQFDAKQPISTYEGFVNTELREIGRLLDIPRGVMIGDSSAYNYSSARLDFQSYDDRIQFEREQLIIRILLPLFTAWFEEFLLVHSSNAYVAEYINLNGYNFILPKHNWQFTKRQSIDPEKDAKASTSRMKNLTSNPAVECAMNGDDWEEVLDGWKTFFEKIQKLGLTNKLASDIMISGDGEIPSTVSSDNSDNVDVKDATSKPEVDVQATALNGAQIASFLLVTDKLAAKQYPPEAAEGIIRAAFPGVSDATIKEIINALKNYTAPVTEPTGNPGLNGKTKVGV